MFTRDQSILKPRSSGLFYGRIAQTGIQRGYSADSVPGTRRRNRGIDGSNMQRRGSALIKAEAPGWNRTEYKAAKDSGAVVLAQIGHYQKSQRQKD